MDIHSYFADRKKLVETALSNALKDSAIPESLHGAMAYSIEAGGKRIRPMLVIAGAEAVGGQAETVMPAAVAIEMIHTFSLIHDDLPAMDDDSLRRGKPTNHKVYGEAMAILAGDGLLADAFYMLAKVKNASEASGERLIETICDMARAAGSRGMTGGQAIDIKATGKKLNEEELKRLHSYKTGALITTSVVSGARLVGATSEQLSALSKYGDAIGLAFQIADDVLDICGNEKQLGKDIGSDVSKGKSTFPAAIGVEESKKRASTLIDHAIATLAGFDAKADPLREIARYIIDRKN